MPEISETQKTPETTEAAEAEPTEAEKATEAAPKVPVAEKACEKEAKTATPKTAETSKAPDEPEIQAADTECANAEAAGNENPGSPSKTKTAKKLTGSIATIVVLAFCLCITTFALAYESVSVENNLFHTGGVDINLNDGKPVIRENEFLFEPGMTVVKDFFIENDSTWDVYYRLYFDDVSGGLSRVLVITIKDGENVLYSGTAGELQKQNVAAADDILRVGQCKNLTIAFHYPEEAGNDTQSLDLTFTLCADATQTKNNPDKLFD